MKMAKLLALSVLIFPPLSVLAQETPAKSDPSSGQQTQNTNESDTAIQLGQPVPAVDLIIGNELPFSG